MVEVKAVNTYALSTANVLDWATVRQAWSWSVREHVEMAKRSGYEGIEIWPQRMWPLSQIRRGRLSTMEKAGILSAHQSARSGSWWSVHEMQKAVWLPRTDSSLVELEQIQKLVEEVPMVLYAEASERGFVNSLFKQRGIQPDPEICEEWQVKSGTGFVKTILEKGFTHVVLDTHHVRRNHRWTGRANALADWRRSVPEMLPFTKEIHVGVGRAGDGGMDARLVVEEARDLLTGGEGNTEVIQMLKLIADAGWNGLVVVEMKPGIFREKWGRLWLSDGDLVETYQGIRETMRRIFGEN